METVEPRAAPVELRFRRASGLWTLAVLVLMGVGVTAGYLQWKAPDLHKIVSERRDAVAAAPRDLDGRLRNWIVYGDPLIHNRLQQMRFSAAQPWLVTHAVTSRAHPGEVEFYGVDLRSMPRKLAHVDESALRVRIPRPLLLGHAPLTGDNAAAVPVHPDLEHVPDARARARELVAWALAGLGQALERDIPGARFAIEIGDEDRWIEASEELPPAASTAQRVTPGAADVPER